MDVGTDELDLALRLGPACLRFWAARGYYRDAVSWLEQSVPVSVGATQVGLNALRAQGVIAFNVIGDSELAGQRWTEAAELARQLGRDEELELIEGGLASVVWEQGDLERALQLRQEGLAHARMRGDRLREAMYLHWIGEIFGELERFDEAERLLLEADAIYRELGNEAGRWNNLHSLGDVALDRHDFLSAATLYGETLESAPGDCTLHAATPGLLPCGSRQRSRRNRTGRGRGESMGSGLRCGGDPGLSTSSSGAAPVRATRGAPREYRRLGHRRELTLEEAEMLVASALAAAGP